MKRLRFILVALLLCSLVAGGVVYAITYFNLIGPRKLNIHGTVTRDGKPLEWKSDERLLSVGFIPEPRENIFDYYRAETDASTGRFEIKNIPAGKYSVQLQQLDGAEPQDVLKMVYDPSSTDIIVEVKEDGQEIKIDIPKVLPPRRTPRPSMPAGRPEGVPGPGERRGDEPPPGEELPKVDDAKKDKEPDKKPAPDAKPKPK